MTQTRDEKKSRKVSFSHNEEKGKKTSHISESSEKTRGDVGSKPPIRLAQKQTLFSSDLQVSFSQYGSQDIRARKALFLDFTLYPFQLLLSQQKMLVFRKQPGNKVEV